MNDHSISAENTIDVVLDNNGITTIDETSPSSQNIDDVKAKIISSVDNLPNDSLSKRARRRLMKKEKWLMHLPEKRQKERIRNKQKRAEARKLNLDLGPSRQALKRNAVAENKSKVHVALDFSFDHLMSSRDICKCVQQVLRSYSENRRAKTPLQLHFVNFNGQSKEMTSRHSGYENWDINFHTETYLDLFPKESLVYLSSESDNVIEKFEDDKIYIIGALVDHNSQKGLCLKIANEEGIKHAQLPIGEYLSMKSRKVLAINHVFSIILSVCNGMTWKDALLNALPQRKGAVAKNTAEPAASSQE